MGCCEEGGEVNEISVCGTIYESMSSYYVGRYHEIMNANFLEISANLMFPDDVRTDRHDDSQEPPSWTINGQG